MIVSPTCVMTEARCRGKRSVRSTRVIFPCPKKRCRGSNAASSSRDLSGCQRCQHGGGRALGFGVHVLVCVVCVCVGGAVVWGRGDIGLCKTKAGRHPNRGRGRPSHQVASNSAHVALDVRQRRAPAGSVLPLVKSRGSCGYSQPAGMCSRARGCRGPWRVRLSSSCISASVGAALQPTEPGPKRGKSIRDLAKIARHSISGWLVACARLLLPRAPPGTQTARPAHEPPRRGSCCWMSSVLPAVKICTCQPAARARAPGRALSSCCSSPILFRSNAGCSSFSHGDIAGRRARAGNSSHQALAAGCRLPGLTEACRGFAAVQTRRRRARCVAVTRG